MNRSTAKGFGIAFAASKKTVAVLSCSDLTFWNASHSKCIKRKIKCSPSGLLSTSEDGKVAAIADLNHDIYVFNLRVASEDQVIIRCHEASISSVSVNSKLGMILSGDEVTLIKTSLTSI